MAIAANFASNHGLAGATVRADDAAKLLLRITLGVLMLLHGFGKLQAGWALELQAFYLAAALAIAGLGAGRYSLGGAMGRWN